MYWCLSLICNQTFINTITSSFSGNQLNTNNLSNEIINRLDDLLPNWANSPTDSDSLSIENITPSNDGIRDILKNAIHQTVVSIEDPAEDDNDNLDFLYTATNFLTSGGDVLRREFSEIVNWTT